MNSHECRRARRRREHLARVSDAGAVGRGGGSRADPVARFVEVTSTTAARLFGLYPRKGTIAPGADAGLVIWNADDTRIVDGATMHSNAGYSPYDGWTVTGWPELTISRGEVIATGGDAGIEVTSKPGRGRGVQNRVRPAVTFRA